MSRVTLANPMSFARFIGDCVDDNGCPKLRSVLADAPAFRHVFSRFGSGLKRALGNARVLILFGVKRAQVLADYFRLDVALDPLCACIPRCDDVHWRRAERLRSRRPLLLGGGTSFAFEQLPGCDLPLGDIARDLRETDNLTIMVMHGINDDARPETRSIFTNAPTFSVKPPVSRAVRRAPAVLRPRMSSDV